MNTVTVTDTIEVDGYIYSFIRPYAKACALCFVGFEFDLCPVCAACGDDGFCITRDRKE